MEEQMICLCREIDKNTGNIIAYPLESEVTERLVFMLGIRQRANPELRYFVTLRENFEINEELILERLSRRNIFLVLYYIILVYFLSIDPIAAVKKIADMSDEQIIRIIDNTLYELGSD